MISGLNSVDVAATGCAATTGGLVCACGVVTADEDGTTLTCIGFRPLPDDIAHAISRKYQLFR